MANFKNILKVITNFGGKNAPVLLVSAGVVGGITAAVVAVKSRDKQLTLEKKLKETKAAESEEKLEEVKLTKKEEAKVLVKAYWKAATLGVLSTACIFGGLAVESKRLAATALALATTTETMKSLEKAIDETIGEEKAQEIRNTQAKNIVQQQHVDKTGEPLSEAIQRGYVGFAECGSDVMPYVDLVTNYMVWTTENILNDARNRYNDILLREEWADISTFYNFINELNDEAGIPSNIEYGTIAEQIGMRLDCDGFMNITYGETTITDGNGIKRAVRTFKYNHQGSRWD